MEINIRRVKSGLHEMSLKAEFPLEKNTVAQEVECGVEGSERYHSLMVNAHKFSPKILGFLGVQIVTILHLKPYELR